MATDVNMEVFVAHVVKLFPAGCQTKTDHNECEANPDVDQGVEVPTNCVHEGDVGSGNIEDNQVCQTDYEGRNHCRCQPRRGPNSGNFTITHFLLGCVDVFLPTLGLWHGISLDQFANVVGNSVRMRSP